MDSIDMRCDPTATEAADHLREAKARKRQDAERIEFALRLANRLFLASEVLSHLAERKQPKPFTVTETDYCPLG